MSKSTKMILFQVMVFLCLLSKSQSEVVVFSDNFDTENGGVGQLNFTGLSNWIILGGTLDLLGNGASDFYPGNGLYLDLDGTSSAVAIQSSSFSLDPGDYQFQFDLGNNDGGNTPNSMTVFIGAGETSIFNEVFTRDGSITLDTITRNFTISSSLSNAALIFNHGGGDSHGLIIDDVLLTNLSASPSPSIPEPSTYVFFCTVIGASVFLNRRIKKKEKESRTLRST